jgi:hypothetical protein
LSYDLSKCIVLLFSRISSLLLLLFLSLLLQWSSFHCPVRKLGGLVYCIRSRTVIMNSVS